MTIVANRPTPSRPAGVPPPPPPQPNRPPVRPAGPAPRSYRTHPTNDPDPVTNPQNPRPKWAVACLIAAAVLAFGALALADVVLVPLAMRGPR